MSAHRQHTLDIPSNPTPIDQIRARRSSPKEKSLILWPPFLLLLAVLTAGLLFAAILHLGRPSVDATPVHQAQAVAVPLAPLQPFDGAQLAQIRLEAFRAGMRSAQENCFGAPVLSSPIAPRP